jgi:hypothetical protein
MPLGANKAAIMGVAGVSTANVVLLQTQTADGDTVLSFTSGIDSTYGIYIFKFYKINPATDNKGLIFQGSIDGGSNYNVSMTTTHFWIHHNEDGSGGAYAYTGDIDQANGTAFQKIGVGLSNDADSAGVGELRLFNPSSTTYVKHFYAKTQGMESSYYSEQHHTAGYFNDADDNIDAIQFKMESGVFDGTIKMWGVK